MDYLLFLLFGAMGGFIRSLIGGYKNSLNVGAGKKLEWGKMLFNILVSTAVGAFVGFLVDQNLITAACAGYAGLDIIESCVKLVKK